MASGNQCMVRMSRVTFVISKYKYTMPSGWLNGWVVGTWEPWTRQVDIDISLSRSPNLPCIVIVYARLTSLGLLLYEEKE